MKVTASAQLRQNRRQHKATENNNKSLPASFGRFSATSLLPSPLMAILSVLYSWLIPLFLTLTKPFFIGSPFSLFSSSYRLFQYALASKAVRA